jgi:hypothetical protein
MADERRAITIMRVSGGAALLLTVVMLAVFPAAPVERNVPGFVSPIVGFELASEPAHVFGILGRPDDPARAAAVRGMNLGNRIDFLFMVAYPALYVGIALLLRARGRLTGGVGRIVLLLPVVMWLGDLLENRELLGLADLTDPAAMHGGLARLRPFTTMKWHALFGTSALVAYPIWQDRSWWRWSGAIFGLAAAIGFASVVWLPAIEVAGYMLALAWLTTCVYSLRA